jgi:hypothetical protein
MTYINTAKNIKFTGGGGLNLQDGLIYGIHKTMMLNELSGGRGAYCISNAIKGNSGPSFGPFQYDLGANTHGRKLLETIINNDTSNIINDYELVQIKQHLYKPFKNFTASDKEVYESLRPKIDKLLSSSQSGAIDAINEDYIKQLQKKAMHVEHIISEIKNPHNKIYVQNNMAAQLIIADTFNQFGAVDARGLSVPKQLLAVLNATEPKVIDIPHSRRRFNVAGNIDINDLVSYKLNTNYGQGNPKDTLRRISNIDKVSYAYNANEYNNYGKSSKAYLYKKTDNILARADALQKCTSDFIAKMYIHTQPVKRYEQKYQQHNQFKEDAEPVIISHVKPLKQIEILKSPEQKKAMHNPWVIMPIAISKESMEYKELEQKMHDNNYQFTNMPADAQEAFIRNFIGKQNDIVLRKVEQEFAQSISSGSDAYNDIEISSSYSR